MSEKPNLPEFPDRNTLLEYLKGGLTPSERHRIERLMLENSSFRKALEGLESEAPELIGKDLSELSEGIRFRSRKISGTGFNFYRLAATVSLIILATAILYIMVDRISQTGHENNLSYKQAVQTENMDSLKDEKSEVTENERTGPDYIAQKKITENEQRAGKITQEESRQAVAQLDNPSVSKEKSGQKVEDQPVNQPVLRHAERLADQEKKMPVSNNKVQSEMENPTLVEEKIPSERIQGEQLMDMEDRLTSAEVEENFSQTDRLKANEAVPSMAMKTALAPGQPQPLIGIENYRKYLEDSLRYPDEAFRNKVEGIVLLNFTIGSDSIPKDIMVKQSLGYGCDREAIRLIREGPHWKPVMQDGKIAKKIVEVLVQFKIPQ